MLETYRVPKAVVKMGSQKKVGRVFRDREELPTSSNLAQSIQEALEISEHLIVICSPRTPESQWVCKEIETFAALHGHDRILPLLIEGEPSESFPEQLRLVKKQVVQADGTVTEIVQEIEPLAADIRAEDLRGMKKKLKTEVLRLLAPILNCRFDDLKQRHRERRIKRILTLSFALSAFFLLFGSYSAYQAALIRQQADVIAQKSEALELQVQKTLKGQSLFLADLALNYLSQGDRLGAVLVAKEGLPQDPANPDRPYVEESEYALAEALGVYQTVYGSALLDDAILRHNAFVVCTALSPDGKKFATVTDNNIVYIWNAENGMLLNTWDPHLSLTEDFFFVDNSSLLFRSYNHDRLICIDAETLEEKWSYSYSAGDLAISRDRSKAAVIGSDLIILDTATGKPLKEISLSSLCPDRLYAYGNHIAFDESGSHVYFSINSDTVVKVDLEQMAAESFYQATYGFVTDIVAGPGERLAVLSYDLDAVKGYALDVFDETGSIICSMTSDSPVESPSFNPFNDDQLIYTSQNNLVILSISEGNPYLCMHSRSVTDYHILENNIISTAYDGVLRFWNMDGTEMFRIEYTHPLESLDFSPGQLFLTHGSETLIVRAHENSHALMFEGHSALIEKLVYLKDSNRLVTSANDGELILWDLAKQEALKTAYANTRPNSIHAVDQGSKILLLTDDWESKLLLYDAATLDLFGSITVDSLTELVLSPDGKFACLFGMREGRIIDTGSLETVMELPVDNVSEVLFFNDSSKAVLKNDRGICILDIPSQAIVKEKPATTEDPTGLCLSHDNSILACISNGKVLLMDANTLEEKVTIDHYGSIPKAVFFDPRDKTLFIAFNDLSVGRFSTADGSLIGMLDKKVAELKEIVFSEERNIYITIGESASFLGSKEAYIWKYDTNKAIGRVPGLHLADLESGRVFTVSYDMFQVLPVFDTRMLLDEAERQLKGRILTSMEKQRLFIVE